MILESDIEVGLCEGDNLHAQKFLSCNTIGVSRSGCNLVREIKYPA